jgi:hypothetical protein
LRAAAIENGLDPDNALPEDILLLSKNKNGDFIVAEELNAAAKKLNYFYALKKSGITYE